MRVCMHNNVFYKKTTLGVVGRVVNRVDKLISKAVLSPLLSKTLFHHRRLDYDPSHMNKTDDGWADDRTCHYPWALSVVLRFSLCSVLWNKNMYYHTEI